MAVWYDEVSGFLSTLGFAVNHQDPCVMDAVRNGHQVTIYLYVDDLFCTSVNDEDLEWIETALKLRYKTISSTKGYMHHFFGQQFDFSKSGVCRVSMKNYVIDGLDGRETKQTYKTPAKSDLLEVDTTSPLLSSACRAKFHSVVAKLLYLATRARPDIILVVNF